LNVSASVVVSLTPLARLEAISFELKYILTSDSRGDTTTSQRYVWQARRALPAHPEV
jgi:hypothetical protein